MRTVPILAGGILLTLVLGTATAVAESSGSTQPEVERVTVAAAPEPTIAAEPVVVVAPTETTEPSLTWSAPTAQPAPEPAELELAPGYEVPTFEPIGDLDVPATDDWTIPPTDAHCFDIVPESTTEAFWHGRGLTLYATMPPLDWSYPWEGYPADELQIMSDHWLANCSWSDSRDILHVDLGAGLDAADTALLQSRVATSAWTAVTLSTGDVLYVDAPGSDEQFPETQAWMLQGDRWMRLILINDVDAVGFAETLLASGLTWP